MKATCRLLVDRFDGRVPTTMDELLTLPGVGRKTANLVLILAFKSLENICVDTHVHRISNRLGWVAPVRRRKPSERFTRPPMSDGGRSQPVSGYVGAERLPSGIPALRRRALREILPADRRDESGAPGGTRDADVMRPGGWQHWSVASGPRGRSGARADGARDRRRDVAGDLRIRDVSRRGAEDRHAHCRPGPARLLRWPTRASRDTGLPDSMGRSAVPRSVERGGMGTRTRGLEREPIGAAEMSKKRTHSKGAVALSHPGNPAQADSQL